MNIVFYLGCVTEFYTLITIYIIILYIDYFAVRGRGGSALHLQPRSQPSQVRRPTHAASALHLQPRSRPSQAHSKQPKQSAAVARSCNLSGGSRCSARVVARALREAQAARAYVDRWCPLVAANFFHCFFQSNRMTENAFNLQLKV